MLHFAIALNFVISATVSVKTVFKCKLSTSVLSCKLNKCTVRSLNKPVLTLSQSHDANAENIYIALYHAVTNCFNRQQRKGRAHAY
jgi:hypothetical protein